ncbi:MAG: DUF4296 domain-containing protein [Bacteroidales bacterium]|nr:DUF4296 domain-containing protein [Bacteroidales bacterium]
MQKLFYFSLLAWFFICLSCGKSVIEKPDNLISEEKMIDLLTDIHLAEATYISRHHQDSLLKKSKSADFYYSILKNHQTADTTFEKSYIFYLSRPRKFEKMYRQVMNNLNEMEQKFSGREKELIDLNLNK